MMFLHSQFAMHMKPVCIFNFGAHETRVHLAFRMRHLFVRQFEGYRSSSVTMYILVRIKSVSMLNLVGHVLSIRLARLCAPSISVASKFC